MEKSCESTKENIVSIRVMANLTYIRCQRNDLESLESKLFKAKELVKAIEISIDAKHKLISSIQKENEDLVYDLHQSFKENENTN